LAHVACWNLPWQGLFYGVHVKSFVILTGFGQVFLGSFFPFTLRGEERRGEERIIFFQLQLFFIYNHTLEKI